MTHKGIKMCFMTSRHILAGCFNLRIARSLSICLIFFDKHLLTVKLIFKGGKLVLEMGTEPNENWGK